MQEFWEATKPRGRDLPGQPRFPPAKMELPGEVPGPGLPADRAVNLLMGQIREDKGLTLCPDFDAESKRAIEEAKQAHEETMKQLGIIPRP